MTTWYIFSLHDTGTTGERPVDRLLNEGLRSLVGPEKLTSFLSEERKVDSDGFFSFDGVRYGAPWNYAGSTVRVRRVGGQVEAWIGDQRIATHERTSTWNGRQQLRDQYKGLPQETSTQCGLWVQVYRLERLRLNTGPYLSMNNSVRRSDD